MGTARTLVTLLLLAMAVGCSESPQRKAVEPHTSPPPSAADVLGYMERERTAGRTKAAVDHARDLINKHPGTAEAEVAARLLPQLEAAVKAQAEAERVRAAEAAAAVEASRLAGKWTYQVSEDAMTSRTSRSALIQSENTVVFGFPYAGPQYGTLILRDHPTYGRDVMLSIERGQFLCHSYTDCQIRVRFDESNPERWSAAGPADNSSTTIFLRNEARFIQRLRASKIVRIQVPVYQEGEPMFEFHVGGFDYERHSKGS